MTDYQATEWGLCKPLATITEVCPVCGKEKDD